MLSAKKYRLLIHNLVLRPMIKCLSRKYFGHVNKPSTAASASHRHYVGFRNYVLTYSLTHLQNDDNVCFASTKLKPQKGESVETLLKLLISEFKSNKTRSMKINHVRSHKFSVIDWSSISNINELIGIDCY